MATLRNRISSIRAGGPRQFSELRDKFIVDVDQDRLNELENELSSMGFNIREIDNSPKLILESGDNISSIIESMADRADSSTRQAIQSIRDSDEDPMNITSPVVDATKSVYNALGDIPGIKGSSFVTTRVDYGPENLRMSPSAAPTLSKERYQTANQTPKDLNENLNMQEAWRETRGENAIVAVFDTGFSQDLVDNRRVVDTWHGEDVSTAYESAEGHGTMCAGASVANADEGVPYNGIAPEAGVIYLRLTDSNGQIRDDYITEAWDWLINQDYNRPVVLNHSYGTPLCSGRPKTKYCHGDDADMVKIGASDPWITPVYAAGNEASTCGRRPSGLTNAVTGVNSLQEVIAVGALRFDERDIQEYSSHGRGDCAPISDPKPNVCAPLPAKTYYGSEHGVQIVDMSTGFGGSSGGTSHASPTTAGMIALIQSKAMDKYGQPLQTEEIKNIIHDTATKPRRTHINSIPGPVSPPGYDARFGHGKINIPEALSEV